ncbi:glycosyl transferase family 1 [Micromonospora sp. NPDC018662]|uniref:glycosyl transferase family 1 n=1 Tax=Micromonospora sp. NPDC018662 TaxID=3364238 RepID=UPI00379F0C71
MLRDEEFPRVLVVGHTPFSRSTGTAMTLSNLFTGWPKDRLAQVYTSTRITPSTDVCENYYPYAPREHYHPAQYYGMRMLGWNGRSPLQQSRAVAMVEKASSRRQSMARLYSHIRTTADLSPVQVSAGLARWMRAFQPDLIYSMLGSVRLTRIAAAAARTLTIPIVPHFTDDWPATLYANGELFGLANRTARHAIHQLLHHAPLGMVISQPMADEYTHRYHIPFTPFANCVDDTYFAPPPPPTPQPHPTELVYIGALHLNRWESLRDIGTALDTITGTGHPARLTIHAPADDLHQYGKHLTHLPRIRLGNPLPAHHVPTALHNADILVHVESFNPDIRRYTRYSISTKIPQYLAASRPILGYGPTEVASMNHIRTANAGITIGDPTTLTHHLTTLCQDPHLRHQLAHNGHTYARHHHTTTTVTHHFATTLNTARHHATTDTPVHR